MDSFIFNEYTKRLLNGEVNSSQVWNFLPVNKKFIETFENCSSLNFKQFRTTADIACYSADGNSESRYNYINNADDSKYNYEYFYDVVNNFSGLVNATYSNIRYKKDTDTNNKPLFIDNSVSDEELEELYNIKLNDIHKSYQDEGFYYVTKVSELNWLADRCNLNNKFNICLGDNIVDESIEKSIGTYENPYQGTFDGAGYVFSSCNINIKNAINGVIGVLGNKGIVKNIRIEDLSYKSNNILTTSFANKNNNDIIAGFVAKNYGQVYDVSSIGDNYIFGVSPSIYSLSNRTDNKSEEYNVNKLIQTGYLIDQDSYSLTRNIYNGNVQLDYIDTMPSQDGEGKIFENVRLVLSANNTKKTIPNNQFVLINRKDTQKIRIWLNDWTDIQFSANADSYSSLFRNTTGIYNIYDHSNGDFRIAAINYDRSKITNKTLSSDFKKEHFYFNLAKNDILYDLTYLHFSEKDWDFNSSTNEFIIKCDASGYKDLTNEDKKTTQFYSSFFINSATNICYNYEDDKLSRLYCWDDNDNIHPYYGYFESYNYKYSAVESLNPSIRYTYLISPIVGSNYNYISGCLNNSNIYFGIDKNHNYNPFAGEFGCIAGYNEGKITNNSSNAIIKDYNGIKTYNQKIFQKYELDEFSKIDGKLIKSIYDENIYLKNYLIYGNIVGRDNLYNDSSKITNNISKLIIEKTDKFEHDYFRPSLLVGSMYLNTCLSSVSSYKSIVSGNTSYLNNSSDASATSTFNELFLNLNEYPNVVHYSNTYQHDGTNYETNEQYINKQNAEIQRIMNKFDNSAYGKRYQNFQITIPNPSYIATYNSYMNINNHLFNCSYLNEKTNTAKFDIKKMSYNLPEYMMVDKGFDIKRYILTADYSSVNLKPLSAHVEFDYDNTNFVIKECENNLYWGTSSDPNEVLKTQNEMDGYVINSKDFAGILVYDNYGNLICYENNYRTNVLYDTYSMKYKDKIIMRID